jgi:hypothetical protein
MERGNTAPLCTPQRNSDVLGAPHGSPDCLLQSAGGGAASLLPLMPPPALLTLLLSQIGQIQALLVGNCGCGNGGGGGGGGGGGSSILRVRLCKCGDGRGGDSGGGWKDAGTAASVWTGFVRL